MYPIRTVLIAVMVLVSLVAAGCEPYNAYFARMLYAICMNQAELAPSLPKAEVIRANCLAADKRKGEVGVSTP